MSYDEGNEDDRDLPQACDLEAADRADESPANMRCPACGAAVWEDTQKCPSCGDWITPVAPRGSKRWLWFIAVALMLLAMLVFAL